MFFSLSVLFIVYVTTVLVQYLIAANLWPGGDMSHLELWCLVVGFLYILQSMFLSSLEMVMSKKKFILLSFSSIVSFMAGVMLLNVLSTSCILVV